MSKRPCTDRAPQPALTGMQPQPWRASRAAPTLDPIEAARAACPHTAGVEVTPWGSHCPTCGKPHPDSWIVRMCRIGRPTG